MKQDKIQSSAEGAVPGTDAEKSESAAAGKRGVRIGMLNAVFIALAVVFALALLYTTRLVQIAGYDLQEVTQRYIDCERAATEMNEVSGYLTAEARLYVSTGDVEHMNNYFNEKYEAKRRELAVQELRDSIQDERALEYLNEALQESEQLEQREYYAMRLVAEVKGLALDEMPAEVAAVELAPEDAALSLAKKRETATNLMIDEAYQASKDAISANVDLCTTELVYATELDQEEIADRLKMLLVAQAACTVLLLAAVIASGVSVMLLVLRPVQRYTREINQNQPLAVSGAAEIRHMAEAYNEMYALRSHHELLLRHQAEHDALTGLFNRGVYNDFHDEENTAHCALLLVDVDFFKRVNDENGHDVGDAVLKKVARSLLHSFRSTDICCRLGGDEFAVIMTEIGPSLRPVVERKLEQLMATLADTSDGLPTVSVSIGVAFSDDDNDGLDVFKAADTALYRVKEESRGDFAFYCDKA